MAYVKIENCFFLYIYNIGAFPTGKCPKNALVVDLFYEFSLMEDIKLKLIE